ncbi:helix-turn-helix domain-containing protein [Gordonia malaquae]|uniref:helix-turn-helix domain-containing protein n=1 Tax=Gordonia malaquae TaxID=410332 RepID=UPI003BF7E5AD
MQSDTRRPPCAGNRAEVVCRDSYPYSPSRLDLVRADKVGPWMVASRRHTLTEIADLLAFSSPGNFSRWFRTRFGRSPSQWRAAHAADRSRATPKTWPSGGSNRDEQD